jgi:hypothetical protein
MDKIRISGREFKAVTDSTLEHDMWTVQQLDRAGIHKIVMEAGETPDEFVARTISQLMISGVIFDLMGGLLMPAELKGTDWTPELAVETGRLFARATGPDKAIIKGEIAGAMEAFLGSALLSSLRSLRSLAPKVETGPAIETTEVQTGLVNGPR